MTRLHQLGRQLEASVVSALTRAGWDVVAAPDGGADLILRREGESLAAVLKVSPISTRPLTEAMLANAVLVAKTVAKTRRARPLAIVGAERISRRTADALHAFARRHFDEAVAYGWIDAQGRLELHGSPRLESVRAFSAEDSGDGGWEPLPKKHTVFSDLGQWILKVLLAPKLPPSLLTAPRTRPESTRHLAQLAAVSEATAHRIVTAAVEQGLLQQTRSGITVVDPSRLLLRWRLEATGTGAELPARWILRKRDTDAALRKALEATSMLDTDQRPSACLGLFAAARRLDLGFVQGVPPHLLLRVVSGRAMESLGLREAEPGENAELLVRQPTFPESTFRGAVHRDEIWATDALQTWLDTSHHPARGDEQADFIHRRALLPALAKGEP